MKLTGIIIFALALLTGLGIWVGSRDKSADEPEGNQVIIESIAPAFGPIGTEITITGSGFSTDENDVGFKLSEETSGFTTGYILPVKSPDSRTLTFKLPEALSACPIATAPPETACPAIALMLPKERVELFVVNEIGQSNTASFVIN